MLFHQDGLALLFKASLVLRASGLSVAHLAIVS